MSVPLWSLLGFALWTVSIVACAIGPWRVFQVLARGAKPNSFPADVPHGPDLYRRLIRVHANCVENLPVFASVVLVGAVAGVSSPWLDRLSVIYLVARICQGIVHAISVRSLAVNVRFAFFFVQVLCLLAMVLLTAALGIV